MRFRMENFKIIIKVDANFKSVFRMKNFAMRSYVNLFTWKWCSSGCVICIISAQYFNYTYYPPGGAGDASDDGSDDDDDDESEEESEGSSDDRDAEGQDAESAKDDEAAEAVGKLTVSSWCECNVELLWNYIAWKLNDRGNFSSISIHLRMKMQWPCCDHRVVHISFRLKRVFTPFQV